MPAAKKRSCLSFRGRAGRKTFWLTWLISMSALMVPIMISGTLYTLGPAYAVPGSLLVIATAFFVCWVMLAVQVKRWHDLDKSGWMILINFIPLVGPIIAIANLGFRAGKGGPNRFDPGTPAAVETRAPPPKPAGARAAPQASVETSPAPPVIAEASPVPPVIAGINAVPPVIAGIKTAQSHKLRWGLIIAAAAMLVGGFILFLIGGVTQVRAWLGDPDACQIVGSQYREGRGRDQDVLKAVTWFEKAAAKGSFKAQYDLGILYYYGIGVDEDREKAGAYFRAAADAGYTPAMVMSGVLLEDETPDNNEARLLWEKAARLQNPWAESLLGSAYLSRYSRTENTDDIIAALYWMESARRHGVEPVGGLLQHVWANLDPDVVEEVTEAVFKHLEEGPPDVAGDEKPAEKEDTSGDSNENGAERTKKPEDSSEADKPGRTDSTDDAKEGI